jgi:predicted transcriptional regulator
VAIRQLGDLEAAVMDRVWKRARPVLVRDILEDLSPERPLAYTTVMTVMDKLHRKGWLRREPRGRAYVYEAVASRESHTARLMRDAWATSDNQAAAFVHFLEQLSEEEARALRAALEICPPVSQDAGAKETSSAAPSGAGRPSTGGLSTDASTAAAAGASAGAHASIEADPSGPAPSDPRS